MAGKSTTDPPESELILFNDAALRKSTALEEDAFRLDRKLKPLYEAILKNRDESLSARVFWVPAARRAEQLSNAIIHEILDMKSGNRELT